MRLSSSRPLKKTQNASLRLNRRAATYCKYVSAHQFSRASPLDLFEQPAEASLHHNVIDELTLSTEGEVAGDRAL
jgi:hypothetical protein